MAKILMINVPAHGHVNPTIAVCKELVERGNEVSYLISDDFKEKIEAVGGKVISYTNEKFESEIGRIMTSIDLIYEKAIEIGRDYDYIIYELMFFRGIELGEALNKPVIRIISTFALNEEIMHKMMQLINDNIAETIKIPENMMKMLSDGSLDKMMKDIIPKIIQGPELNIVFTSEKFQISSELFNKKEYKFVGPSITDRKQENNIPMDKLKEKVIYISLGTVFNNSVSFFNNCIEAFKDTDMSIIMSIGKNVSKNELLHIPNNFIVREFVPQIEVLKIADLFITHAGMNSANEAIYFGVPVIAVPQSADQPIVAERMEELGLGKVIDREEVSAENLRNAAYEVLNDSLYIENMKLMKVDMEKGGGFKKAADYIEEYMGK